MLHPLILLARVGPFLLCTLALRPAGAQPAPASAEQTAARPSAAAVRAEQPPIVDGRLNDPAWTRAEPLTRLVQVEPYEGRPVSERTEVRFLHDDQALYVGASLFDTGELVIGRALRDAPLTDSDAFLLILDTYLDRQNGLVFATTPAGIEYDGQVVNEGQGGVQAGAQQTSGSGAGFNINWNGNWQVATSRDSAGWYVEMRIPFSTLRYRDAGPQTWGMNFERRIRRKGEQAMWSPLPRQHDLHRLSLAGTLALETPARRVIAFSPYALTDAFRDHRAVDAGTRVRSRVGGDAKLGLGPTLILDLTANTDFAQAEVDEQQVNLTRFSLFFPEKRAFFLENAGLFAFGSPRTAELFFSRQIGLANGLEVPIRAGGRLTGRVGDYQVGLLTIRTGDLTRPDPTTGAALPVAPANLFTVARTYREMSNRTRVGAIAASRVNADSSSDHNLALGVDGRLGIGQDLTLDAWTGLTFSSDLRAAPGGGNPPPGFNRGEYGFSGSGRYVTRLWQVSAEYREIGEQFNPEVGFLNRRGYRNAYARVLRHLRTPRVPWFREFRPHVSWNQFWGLDGFVQSYLLHVDNHFAFQNGAFFQLPGFNVTGEGLQQAFEIRPGIVIPAGSYDNVDWEFRANTNRGAPLSLSGGWDLGGFYTGTRFGPTATVAYRAGDRFGATLQGSWFDVRLAEGQFQTSVLRLTSSWTFTPRVVVQGNVQYNADVRDVTTNLRLTFLQRGGSGLFVVFNDAEHVGSLERTGLAAGPRQRQVIVKYSHLVELSR